MQLFISFFTSILIILYLCKDLHNRFYFQLKKMKHNTKHSLSFVWRNVKKRDEISR